MMQNLGLFSHPEKVRIVEALLERPRTQEELRNDLGIERGTASKWVNELIDGEILQREGRRGPLWVINPGYVAQAIRGALQLEHKINADRAERHRRQAQELDARVQRLGQFGLAPARDGYESDGELS